MENPIKITRRQFVRQVTAASAGVLALSQYSQANVRSASEMVNLGQSGIKVSRLGVGTGTNSGHVQREMGQENFTSMIHHAFERGITFYDTADNYGEMHERLAVAIKSLDREKIQIQTKIPPRKFEKPLQEIDRYRREVGTDYFDSVLIHCVRTPDWIETFKKLRDELEEAKEKKWARSIGVSMHGLPPLNRTVESDWGDIRLVRVNHNGTHMDNLRDQWNKPGNVDAVIAGIKKMHAEGKGIIGMKLIGNGDFKDPQVRRKSIEFVMALDCVDASVIGFKSPEEIDEAIENINRALQN
jgi:1-deoxyxylulose-5-phosphate synthase